MRPELKVVVSFMLALHVPSVLVVAHPPRYRVEVVDGLVMPPFDIPARDRLIGLNNAGVAVGSRHTDAGVNVAIRVEGGAITDLPTPAGYAFAEAWGINDSGVVFGDATNTEWVLGVPVVWSGGAVEFLPLNPAWGYHGVNDINDAGVLVGTAYPSSGPTKAWIIQGGSIEQLPLPEGFDAIFDSAQAFGVNSVGDIVGAVNPFDDLRPVLWQDTTAELLPMPEGVAGAAALRINDAGMILGGNLDHSGVGYRSFVWAGDEVVELAPLPSGVPHIQATAMNNLGQVVGQACTAASFTAFLWHGGVTHDLQMLLTNPHGVQLHYALDINDAGVMIGAAFVDGQPRSVLLDPVTCLADWLGDGDVNSTDISAYLTTWLASVTGGHLNADLNWDGAVSSADIAVFLSEWLAATGTGC